jgi:hypothetical protein
MNPTLRAQIRTLKNYQAWRTGEDMRTMDEAGIVPAAITSALDAVLKIAEKYLRDGLNDPASFNDANCSECGKSAADGWALYCVACVEKFNSVNVPSDDDLSELMGRFVGYSGHIHDDAFIDCARTLLAKYGTQK